MYKFYPLEKFRRVLPLLKVIPLKIEKKPTVLIRHYIKLLNPPYYYPRLHLYVMTSRIGNPNTVKVSIHEDEEAHRHNYYSDKIQKMFNLIEHS